MIAEIQNYEKLYKKVYKKYFKEHQRIRLDTCSLPNEEGNFDFSCDVYFVSENGSWCDEKSICLFSVDSSRIYENNFDLFKSSKNSWKHHEIWDSEESFRPYYFDREFFIRKKFITPQDIEDCCKYFVNHMLHGGFWNIEFIGKGLCTVCKEDVIDEFDLCTDCRKKLLDNRDGI